MHAALGLASDQDTAPSLSPFRHRTPRTSDAHEESAHIDASASGDGGDNGELLSALHRNVARTALAGAQVRCRDFFKAHLTLDLLLTIQV